MKRLLLLYITSIMLFACEQETVTIGNYNQKALEVGRSTQNYDSAIYYATQNLKLTQSAADHYFSYYIIASSHEKQQAYQKAAVNYVNSLQNLPEGSQHDELRYQLLYNIGLICKRYANYDLAINYYKQASNYVSDKNKIWLYYNLGNAYKEKENIEEAAYMYSESLRLSLLAEKEIEQAKAYNQIGLLYSSLEDYDKARSQYLTIINNDRNTSELYQKYKGYALHNMGSSYLYEKNYNKAVEYFLKASKLNRPDKEQFVTYFDLGKCYEAKGELSLAVDYYRKACELFPATEPNREFLKVHHRLGEVAFQLKRYEESHLAAGRYFAETDDFLAVKEQQLALFSSTNMQSAVDNVILTYRKVRQIKEYKYQLIGGGIALVLLLVFLIRFTIRNIRLKQRNHKLETVQQQVMDVLME